MNSSFYPNIINDSFGSMDYQNNSSSNPSTYLASCQVSYPMAYPDQIQPVYQPNYFTQNFGTKPVANSLGIFLALIGLLWQFFNIIYSSTAIIGFGILRSDFKFIQVSDELIITLLCNTLGSILIFIYFLTVILYRDSLAGNSSIVASIPILVSIIKEIVLICLSMDFTLFPELVNFSIFLRIIYIMFSVALAVFYSQDDYKSLSKSTCKPWSFEFNPINVVYPSVIY